jgi:hypothetical protein
VAFPFEDAILVNRFAQATALPRHTLVLRMIDAVQSPGLTNVVCKLTRMGRFFLPYTRLGRNWLFSADSQKNCERTLVD